MHDYESEPFSKQYTEYLEQLSRVGLTSIQEHLEGKFQGCPQLNYDSHLAIFADTQNHISYSFDTYMSPTPIPPMALDAIERAQSNGHFEEYAINQVQRRGQQEYWVLASRRVADDTSYNSTVSHFVTAWDESAQRLDLADRIALYRLNQAAHALDQSVRATPLKPTLWRRIAGSFNNQ